VGLEIPLWRAVAVFRVAALGYAAVLIARHAAGWTRPAGAWIVLGVMVAWTAFAVYAYSAPQRRRWPLLAADFAVTAACALASRWVIPHGALAVGEPTLPMAWVASPVLAWAIAGGRRVGAVAALLMGAVDLIVRWHVNEVTINTTVLLLLAGVIIGHVARLAATAEERLQRMTELEAATRERERLARGIHDSVLQVLALVQRRGAEIGGEAAELGRLAGEQGATLRALVATEGAPTIPGGTVDLRATLAPFAAATVSIAAPASPVPLPDTVAVELSAAVASALDNVRVHCGPTARAWVLVEDEGDHVAVTVRDEGPGVPDGRLEQAEAEGRLGVALSIRGRVRDLGGTASVVSAPGNGTEVELRIPRKAPAARG
jgi:signal transduction histidine kinase